LPDAALLLRAGLIVRANAHAARLLGGDMPTALAGIHWHRLTDPERWAELEFHLGETVPHNQRLAHMELELRTIDDRRLVAQSSCAGFSADGQSALLVLLRDDDERGRVEAELREQRLLLEQLVAERTADLRQALADARFADRAKDTFLANVSHELRTPLGAVIGLSALALRHCDDPMVRGYLEKIDRAGKHLSRVINDLLDLSKIAAGRMTIDSKPFSLRSMLQRVQGVIGHKADTKGLQLRFRVDNEVPDALVGDPLRLEQIVLNLVGNAIKFTSAGSVELHVSLPASSDAHARILLEVADTGIGMSPEEISSLFQPFSQASMTTSRTHGGTGLGLALSQRLAEAMGGRITVRSRPGSGSVFSLGLRLGRGLGPGGQGEPSPAADTPRNFGAASILLVEDDPLNAEVVRELLFAVGLSLRLARNGREAVNLLTEAGPKAFDLVLMDLQMPLLDGLAATREIRAMPGFATLPIVALTAHALEHERQACLAAGMNDHVAKPFEVSRLHALLERWLGADAGDAAELPALPGIIDVDTAMRRFGGNAQRYRHWLARFVEEAPAVAPAIRQALAADRREEAAEQAHSFKGTAGTLGLVELSLRSGELESALNTGRDGVPELRLLERAIEEARREIVASFGI
jgi:two-component system sensor histidine kinase/response regulator